MAEDTTTTTTSTTPQGTDPVKTDNSSQVQTDFDPATLSDEQISKVLEDKRLWNHNRIVELRDAKKERDALKQQQSEADEKRLIEQKKFEDLFNKEKEQSSTLKEQIKSIRLDGAIERAAVKAGAVDPEAVLKLIDRSGISIDDTTGQIAGINEAIEALIKDKEYLVGKGNNVTIGNPTNPASHNTQLKRFTHSQIQDARFYKANEKDILASIQAGLVVDDSKQ